jgi:hypothetical protein
MSSHTSPCSLRIIRPSGPHQVRAGLAGKGGAAGQGEEDRSGASAVGLRATALPVPGPQSDHGGQPQRLMHSAVLRRVVFPLHNCTECWSGSH